MPTVQLLSSKNKPPNTISYGPKNVVRFIYELGQGDREYTYAEEFKTLEIAKARYENTTIKTGSKKRLSIVIDNKNHVIAREIF